MLKAELHAHTVEDEEEDVIRYNAKELIDYCAKKGFEVLAITLHNKLLFNEELRGYAEERGIVLIPAYEPRLNGKDVLVYNVDEKDIKGVKSIGDLYELKKRKKDVLIAAAHPFFVKKYCLKNLLVKHINLFDAIEYSHFYTGAVNLNNKAARIARRYKKPMIGTSDAHFLGQMNHTYTLVDAERNVKSVIDAIKKGKVKVVTKPLPLRIFFGIMLWSIKETIKRSLR